jgi:YgiT-type zinc finger domain-containing protein
MNTIINITICPSCGSQKIHRQECDVTGNYHGQSYIIPAVSFYECPDCGEKVYDREAMRKIERYSPAFQKRGVSKRPLSQKKLSVLEKKKRQDAIVISYAPER